MVPALNSAEQLIALDCVQLPDYREQIGRQFCGNFVLFPEASADTASSEPPRNRFVTRALFGHLVGTAEPLTRNSYLVASGEFPDFYGQRSPGRPTAMLSSCPKGHPGRSRPRIRRTYVAK
jgi:hypothetical protein